MADAPPRCTSGFSRLPAELRVKIFGYLFLRDGPIRPIKVIKRHPTRFKARALRINRVFHAEAALVLYEQNQYIFATLKHLITFLRLIGPANCALLKDVIVKKFRFEWHEANDLEISPFTGEDLASLSVRERFLDEHNNPTLQALKNATTEFAEACPNLERLQVEGVKITGRLEMMSYRLHMEKYTHLVERMAHLTNVTFCWEAGSLVLGVERMEDAERDVVMPRGYQVHPRYQDLDIARLVARVEQRVRENALAKEVASEAYRKKRVAAAEKRRLRGLRVAERKRKADLKQAAKDEREAKKAERLTKKAEKEERIRLAKEARVTKKASKGKKPSAFA